MTTNPPAQDLNPKEESDHAGSHHQHTHLGVLRNYITVFIGHAGSALIGFITSVILARYLTQDDFGIYSAYVALATIFATLVDIGISQSLVRFGAVISQDNDKESLSRMIGSAIKGKLVFGVLLGTLGGTILSLTALGENLGDRWLVLLVPIGGVMLSFFYMLTSVLQIKRAFKKVSFVTLLKSMILIATIAAAIALGMKDPLTMSFLFVASAAVTVALFWGEIRRLLSTPIGRGPIINVELKRLLQFGKWIGISGMSFAIFEQIPTAAALAMFGSADVALLSVALVLVGALRILNVPLLTILMPDLSNIRTSRELKAYLKITYKFVIPVAFAILVSMIYFAEDIIVLFYGSSYSDSAILFSILLIPFILVFATLPLTSANIYVFNKPQIPAAVNVIQLIAIICIVTVFSGNVDIVLLAASYAAIRGGGTLAVAIVGLFGVFKWPVANPM